MRCGRVLTIDVRPSPGEDGGSARLGEGLAGRRAGVAGSQGWLLSRPPAPRPARLRLRLRWRDRVGGVSLGPGTDPASGHWGDHRGRRG